MSKHGIKTTNEVIFCKRCEKEVSTRLGAYRFWFQTPEGENMRVCSQACLNRMRLLYKKLTQ